MASNFLTCKFKKQGTKSPHEPNRAENKGENPACEVIQAIETHILS